ncbi:MAG: hypothetical protein A2103_01110 [Gammaproteobacteria bacterium GWF2_41_13]|nr:MAG: hypothetical protein A2103_01110 [Gammaproteobacteria bacterium GWF2_41_13]
MLVYLAQLSHESGQVYQNHCFPLAVGFIGAYLKKEFGDEINIELFKSPHELSRALTHKVPEVVMFSNYMWNCNISTVFAEKIRSKYADVLIVMGGPNISSDSEKRYEFLKMNAAIDLYVIHEGEIAAKKILEKFIEKRSIKEAKKVRYPSIICAETIYDNQMMLCDQEQSKRIGTAKEISLDDLPSPYLTHMMDKFFIDHEVPLIETNRGCPFTCAFCQQGMGVYNRVIHHSIERVEQEIKYIAQRIQKNACQINDVEVADSNFGMYSRDRQICVALREVQDATGFPNSIGSSTGKNKVDLIIDNLDIVQRGSMLVRSAIQSTNEATLKAIKRENIKQDMYIHIQREMESRGLENNADLMLGLPMETKESHFKAVFDLINSGVKEFSCLQTIVLKGTVMESEQYRKEYGIETKYRIIPECFGEYEIMGERKRICEAEEIIIKTNTMSFDDYLECRKLHLLVMIFHNTRLLSLVYAVLDYVGIDKSVVIKNIYCLNDPQLNILLENFIRDTKSELFENLGAIHALTSVDEHVSYNKIFKHLALALFKHKDFVMDVTQKVLHEMLGATYFAAVEELIPILKADIINPFEQIRERLFEIHTENLKDILGPHISLNLSDNQAVAIEAINRLYEDPEDKINKMVYKLRPKNITLKVNFFKDLAKH